MLRVLSSGPDLWDGGATRLVGTHIPMREPSQDSEKTSRKIRPQDPMRTGLCPNCESMNLQASHRKGFWERRVLTLRGIRPLVCNDCQTRFYSKRPPHY